MRDFPWYVFPVAMLTWAWYGASSERDALLAEQAAQQEAVIHRDAAIKGLAREYEKLYQDIDARPAPTVERVFIKTDCVPTTDPAGLDDGTQPGRVELDPGSVGRITRVTDRWQRDFEKCSVKLEAIHESLRTQ